MSGRFVGDVGRGSVDAEAAGISHYCSQKTIAEFLKDGFCDSFLHFTALSHEKVINKCAYKDPGEGEFITFSGLLQSK